MKELIVGFREFLMRGNLIELAVAFVMGVAFVNLVDSLVGNLVTPLIAAVVGEPSLSSLDFEINNAVFGIGAFVDQVINFVAVAAAVYFIIVVPYNTITARMKRGENEPESTTKVCPECMSTVPREARRCAHCTSALVAV